MILLQDCHLVAADPCLQVTSQLTEIWSPENGNGWLQEWIHEELAKGEVWHTRYEMLLEEQTQLCSLQQAKSLKPLEKKIQALQKELEEVQESLQECWSRSCKYRLCIHKQVVKRQLEEKSGNDRLKKMRTEDCKLKTQLLLENLSAPVQELSLMSQELQRYITLLEDDVMKAQLEADLFQKEVFFEPARTSFLWDKRAPDWMKRFLYQEPERINTMKQLLSRCVPCTALWTAWRLLWALTKALPLLLLLVVVSHFLYHFFFSCQPCSCCCSAPFLDIKPKI
ncbi:uncharacterized protein LOC129346527 [Eublepharis macularius]|uniref:Uncharacterized protein LOC129346527 n=1 Tax=Eublepharis macularius TaxID=481883 RepID=A0AA97KQ87_EUBMA|nr:uncharacterized protein LOC129346527 [Eublepharis macularius]